MTLTLTHVVNFSDDGLSSQTDSSDKKSLVFFFFFLRKPRDNTFPSRLRILLISNHDSVFTKIYPREPKIIGLCYIHEVNRTLAHKTVASAVAMFLQVRRVATTGRNFKNFEKAAEKLELQNRPTNLNKKRYINLKFSPLLIFRLLTFHLQVKTYYFSNSKQD